MQKFTNEIQIKKIAFFNLLAKQNIDITLEQVWGNGYLIHFYLKYKLPHQYLFRF